MVTLGLKKSSVRNQQDQTWSNLIRVMDIPNCIKLDAITSRNQKMK